LENLTICIDAPHVPLELHARAELSSLYAQTARPEVARPHLARCGEILAAGEDWRGLVGHIARAEAMVAAAEGRFEAANEQFAKAVAIYRRYQVPFEEAEALHYWGRALIKGSDGERALEKLDAAAELYRRHGAGERWIDAIQADRSHAQSAGAGAKRGTESSESPASAGNGQPREAAPTAIFRRQGEYWTLSWANTESRLKDRRGLHYIAWLLRYPGREVAVQDLVFAIEPASNGAPTSGEAALPVAGLGDAGAALDAAAKAQYRRRLEDLRDELEQAERHNDIGRADKAREEIEFIEAEFAAAMGLGGRDRKSASHAERARVAVTKAIKSALSGVRRADPELGRHLSVSIRTGYVCVYLPAQSITWQL
jgi:hypothetical protein